MKRATLLFTLLGGLTVGLNASCGGGSDTAPSPSPDQDAYQFVSEWTLPGAAALSGLHIAATSQAVYVSASFVGPDSVYLYAPEGTYLKDLVGELASVISRVTRRFSCGAPAFWASAALKALYLTPCARAG